MLRHTGSQVCTFQFLGSNPIKNIPPNPSVEGCFIGSDYICMVISSKLSGNAACNFYFTFVTITFTEGKVVSSETNESLFHKRFRPYMFQFYQNIYSRAQNAPHLIENSYYLKERAFITLFLSREK